MVYDNICVNNFCILNFPTLKTTRLIKALGVPSEGCYSTSCFSGPSKSEVTRSRRGVRKSKKPGTFRYAAQSSRLSLPFGPSNPIPRFDSRTSVSIEQRQPEGSDERTTHHLGHNSCEVQVQVGRRIQVALSSRPHRNRPRPLTGLLLFPCCDTIPRSPRPLVDSWLHRCCARRHS